MARPLGQVLCNAAGQRPHSRSQPRPSRQSGLFGISDNMSHTLHFGADYDETRDEYKMEFCDETLRKYIARGTAIWRSRRASGSLSSFYMGLTTFTAKAFCIAEDVGRVVRPR
jgi:hypothetical protein